MYVDKEPRKKHLISQLNPIKSQWYSIGEQLEVQDGDLKTIQLNESLFRNDSLKLSEVFQKWSDGRTVEVSWRMILDVIRSPPISNVKVFYDVQKFLSCPEIQHLYLNEKTMVVTPVATKPIKPPPVATKPTKPPPVATKPPSVATKPTKPPLVVTKPKRGSNTDLIKYEQSKTSLSKIKVRNMLN